ncbi:GMC oxidoreductase [Colletotrichum higginsianum IMI 349063]|uniref:GMC oxidoreductase n=2 Tax=Colletotrichum higginsianum (strain IMI 349063) TaxID=759273 RepID=A0A1B7XSH2_COLHI|nr:GMC oxidoreductase [Colletotrichum higginsianum IMI 349063]OBR02738.1 GMC oxidoreductase [Colletotrichum higginsianum IMI 349063]GJD00693.1 GMC oxidoreductase [Colletotrichum higginsianum]
MKLITVTSALLALGEMASASLYPRSNTTTTTIRNATYDYIVAGAGTAGIVAAERLAASGRSVLLVERGGPSLYMSGYRKTMPWNDTVTMYDVPGMSDYTGADPDLQYCRDLVIAAGCMLGGSTMLNALMFVRPRAADFAGWPEEWRWENGVALAAEEFYERLPGTILASEDGKRYDDGAYEIMSRFLDANGWSEQDALNDVEAKELMYSHPPWSIAHGLRDSPVRSILPDAEALPNFTLELHAKVLRAVRDGGLVTGVEVENDSGAREIINLAKGGSLVLAAGSHSTPRVLFNSGIGPAAQIEIVAAGTTGITLPPREQWIELPVGENLKDHAVATVVFQTEKDALVALPDAAWTDPGQESVELFARGSGLLAQSGQRLNFWTSVNATADGATRYIQGTVRADANDTIGVKVYLTHGTTSAGTVGITADGTTNMTRTPLLHTEGDREALTKMVDTLLGYARRPGSILSVAGNATAEAIVATAGSGSHYLGTAQMGARNDGNSVVDPDTRVWGTENLFVVDGSIHPEVPTGNTQAPIMVAAAFAAKRILALNAH